MLLTVCSSPRDLEAFVGEFWKCLEILASKVLECCKQSLMDILVGVQKTRILIRIWIKGQRNEVLTGNQRLYWKLNWRPRIFHSGKILSTFCLCAKTLCEI